MATGDARTHSVWWFRLCGLALLLLLAAPAHAGLGSEGPAATLSSAELLVPLVGQVGEATNCGPTAAAMVLAAYAGQTHRAELEQLRDRLGQWSWGQFPLRRFKAFGYDAGMTTPAMMLDTLNRFGGGLTFADIGAEHPWLPREAWAIVLLRASLQTGRPLIALVQSSVLWGSTGPGLHWVVVLGLEGGQVIFNDPADGQRNQVTLTRFWDAWRLNPLFRDLGVIRSFVALAPDRPLPSVASRNVQARLEPPRPSAAAEALGQ
jgi:hypothetical protein